MISRFKASVRLKLVAAMLAATLAAVVFTLAAIIAYELRTYHRNALDEAVAQAEVLGRSSMAALAFDDSRVAQENVEVLRTQPGLRAAAIYDARGRIFASFSRAAEEEGALPRLPEADGVRIDGDNVVVFRRITNEREILGTVYLRREYQLYHRLLGYLGVAGVVALLAMLAAYGMAWWLQGLVSGPLLALSRVANEVAERRDFSLRAPAFGNDEIGRLGAALNTMLAETDRATRDLQASNEEVMRLNAELERRVHERTVQLESANAELEAFCYSVSHDLRAPLRAIDGFSQALIEDFPKDVPEQAGRYLGRIRASAQRMAQLIEDLLNLSKVSRGELQRGAADVTEIAEQVVADLRGRDAGRAIDVQVWEGMQAHADPRLLRTALENLIGNAWKFTSKTEAARIEVGATRDAGGGTVFFVRDNGAGFDMAYASKLFGAFQRLHTPQEFQGTGIGLATVQRIVHRHGGRIWADARPGKGAAFFFTLAPAEVAVREPAQQEVQA